MVKANLAAWLSVELQTCRTDTNTLQKTLKWSECVIKGPRWLSTQSFTKILPQYNDQRTKLSDHEMSWYSETTVSLRFTMVAGQNLVGWLIYFLLLSVQVFITPRIFSQNCLESFGHLVIQKLFVPSILAGSSFHFDLALRSLSLFCAELRILKIMTEYISKHTQGI